MSDTLFANWWTVLLATVASGLLIASFVLRLREWGVRPLRDVSRIMHQSWLERILLMFFVCGMVQYAATKGTNGVDRGALTGSMRSPAPVVVPTAVDSTGFSLPTNFPSITNLCFWGIEHGDDSVALGIAWPSEMSFTNECIDIFGSCRMSSNGWWRLAQLDVGEICSNAIVELEYSDLPTNAMHASAFYRMASQDDFDGDGLSDKLEEWCFGTNPNCSDSDGDLIEDGEEIDRGMNPHSDDSDGDGLSDMAELCMYETDPLEEDSDGDGLPDGWEIAQGLDPLNAYGIDGADGDPYFDGTTNMDRYLCGGGSRMISRSGDGASDYVSPGASWVTVTGDLPVGVTNTQNGVVTIPEGTKAFVGVFLHSEEYPQFTSYASQFNDVLSWNISAAGNASIIGSTQVNDEDGDWSAAAENDQSIESWDPVVFQAGGIYSAMSNADLQINITISAVNISDGQFPSTVIVGVFPLENVQSNWPTGMGIGMVTDSGMTVNKRLKEDGIGYVTGTPARPVITSVFADLPEWVDVVWSAMLAKERSERPASDNRTVSAMTMRGDQEFDLYGEIDDMIGGSVVVTFNIDGRFSGTSRYKVRGKNPRDANARTFIDSHVPAAASSYAWKIAVHESRQGTRIYNQFNTGSATIEQPNKGSGFGWGIAQIDNHAGDVDQTPSTQVWDWHENIAAMSNKLAYAIERTETFIGYYRDAYGNHVNWVEPPAKTVIGVSVSAEMWSVLTIYNGVGGIPVQSAGNHTGFRSPLEFNPVKGRWIFHSNTANPDYVRRVVGAGMIQSTRE